MAVSIPIDIDARRPHSARNPTPSLNSPSSLNSLRSRIPVFGRLRQLVGISPVQEQDGSPKAHRGAKLATNDSNALRSSPSSSSASSGYTTPRSESPDTLDLTILESSPPPESRDAEQLRSNAAEMAVRLWMMARDPVRCPDPRWQAQARTMQIDAVKYMHMALPPDLSAAEIASIRACIPQQVLADVPTDHRKRRPTALRRVVARVVALLMALLIFAVPLLTSLTNTLLKYERDHHVTERVFVSAQGALGRLFQYRVCLQATTLHFLSSPAGRGILTSGGYLVDGFAGGVLDGCCGYREAPVDAQSISSSDPKMMVGLPVQVGRGP